MNENQKVLKNALYEYVTEGHITHNKYREVLDVCLAALEEPAQASESKQVDLKELQFYFEDVYSNNVAKFGHDLIYYVNTGVLKAKEKDKRLFGMQPSIITFDEMPKETLTDKFKNLVQVKKNKKDEAVHVPAGAIVEPEPMKVEYVGNEWLYKQANEFRRNVLEAFRELYKNERITFEEYADNVAAVDSFRIAMNSEPKEEQLDKIYKHKTNVFRQEPTVQGEIKFERLEGAKFIREPDEKDEYAAAIEEWQASFEKWKESQTLSFERMNEIADKVNKIYAVLNERVHPLVKRIDNDVHQVKKQTEASVNKSKEQGIKNKTLDDYPLTERQLKQVADYVNVNLKINSDTNINDLVKQLKDEIAKDLKENRLKGKLY